MRARPGLCVRGAQSVGSRPWHPACQRDITRPWWRARKRAQSSRPPHPMWFPGGRVALAKCAFHSLLTWVRPHRSWRLIQIDSVANGPHRKHEHDLVVGCSKIRTFGRLSRIFSLPMPTCPRYLLFRLGRLRSTVCVVGGGWQEKRPLRTLLDSPILFPPRATIWRVRMRQRSLPFVRLAAGVGVSWLVWLPCGSFAQTSVRPPERYAAAMGALERFIGHELTNKGLPALSIALVDNQEVIWAKGFGFRNPTEKIPATADTVYRVGSVSKLFTDIGIMQFVERGVLDLDAPVSRYLPDFKPNNPSGKPITLRQLMAHRSGLVREPPIGHYFDPTQPSLAQTVQSLNTTQLVYPPLTKIKYSNAAVATAGLVLEQTQKEPFAKYLKRAVLDPLGLEKSSFEPDPALMKDLAHGIMWTYHGRVFDAPTFPLGMAPAGSMYSTVNDLASFLKVLFADGRGPGGPVLKPSTIEQMWTPQFAPATDKTGFGIGFLLSEREGHRCIGHNGAIYGFATELLALPDEKLGVAVVAAKDCANDVARHIADVAVTQMLAVRKGQPPPTIEESAPLAPERARRLAGRYAQDGKGVDLIERNGKLFALPLRGGFRAELRGLGDALIMDDPLEYGPKVLVEGDRLIAGKATFARVPVGKPAAPPARWDGLIGEYGWD